MDGYQDNGSIPDNEQEFQDAEGNALHDLYGALEERHFGYDGTESDDDDYNEEFFDTSDILNVDECDDKDLENSVTNHQINIKPNSDSIEITLSEHQHDMQTPNICYTILCGKVYHSPESKLKCFKNQNRKYTVSKLAPNTEYSIYVCEVQDCVERSITTYHTKTTFAGPPDNFQIKYGRPGCFNISWEKPIIVADGFPITGYLLEVRDSKTNNVIESDNIIPNASVMTIELDPDRTYNFSLSAMSSTYEGSKAAGEVIQLKHKLSQINLVEHTNNGRQIKQLQLNAVNTPGNLVCVKEFGMPKLGGLIDSEKIILLLGETGTGKTTWVNAFINYLLNVNRNDRFRFKLIQESDENEQTESVTQDITIYKLHHQEGMAVDYSVTIIDTPGFGDTRGVGRDKDIESAVSSLFQRKNGYLEHINAVGFVIPESQKRLTPTQKYIFDSILSLFGKNIQENLMLLTTFTCEKSPHTLKLAQAHGIEIDESRSFCFENAVVLDTEEEDENDDDGVQIADGMWDEAMKNYREFSVALRKTEPKSISQTQNVLDERAKVRVHLSSMMQSIEDGMLKLDKLGTEAKFVECLERGKKHNNKDVTFKDVEYKAVTDPKVNLICQKCKFTCHENCHIHDEKELHQCIVMDQTRNPVTCKLCPNKCSWDTHRALHSTYRRCLVGKVMKTKDVMNDINVRYEKKSNKPTLEEIKKEIDEDFESMSCRVKAYMSEINNSLKNLEGIALLHWPKSQADYFNQLIETERQEKREGYESRLELLQRFRKEADEIELFQSGDYDPFLAYRVATDEVIAEGTDVQKPKGLRKIFHRVLPRLSKKKKNKDTTNWHFVAKH